MEVTGIPRLWRYRANAPRKPLAEQWLLSVAPTSRLIHLRVDQHQLLTPVFSFPPQLDGKKGEVLAQRLWSETMAELSFAHAEDIVLKLKDK